MRSLTLVLLLLMTGPAHAGTMPAAPEQAAAEIYYQDMALAAGGRGAEAVAMLDGAVAVMPPSDIWRSRMQAATALLAMQQRHAAAPALAAENRHVPLMRHYLQLHPVPEATQAWWPALLGVVPGAGHLWLGRLHDAATAALLVWPMLLLTFWAMRRGMGPVTLFFAGITIWLWSGTIFSAYSLAERGDLESYLGWWQGLWQASGLPGRPW